MSHRQHRFSPTMRSRAPMSTTSAPLALVILQAFRDFETYRLQRNQRWTLEAREGP